MIKSVTKDKASVTAFIGFYELSRLYNVITSAFEMTSNLS